MTPYSHDIKVNCYRADGGKQLNVVVPCPECGQDQMTYAISLAEVDALLNGRPVDGMVWDGRRGGWLMSGICGDPLCRNGSGNRNSFQFMVFPQDLQKLRPGFGGSQTASTAVLQQIQQLSAAVTQLQQQVQSINAWIQQVTRKQGKK